jgi:hypothetical protein
MGEGRGEGRLSSPVPVGGSTTLVGQLPIESKCPDPPARLCPVRVPSVFVGWDKSATGGRRPTILEAEEMVCLRSQGDLVDTLQLCVPSQRSSPRSRVQSPKSVLFPTLDPPSGRICDFGPTFGGSSTLDFLLSRPNSSPLAPSCVRAGSFRRSGGRRPIGRGAGLRRAQSSRGEGGPFSRVPVPISDRGGVVTNFVVIFLVKIRDQTTPPCT